MNSAPTTPAPIADCWQAFREAVARLPDTVTMPPELTAEGKRLHAFRKTCDPEFMKRIDRAKLPNPAAFDAVAQWDGTYPGRLAIGRTGTGKTRAAWSALGRLYVEHNRKFKWYPVRSLTMALDAEEAHGGTGDFFRHFDHFQVLMIDDIDKINWQFDSTKQQLFAFYDWVYRTRKPCLTTTNKDRAWWAKMMGDAFARRLFEDAHQTVQF